MLSNILNKFLENTIVSKDPIVSFDAESRYEILSGQLSINEKHSWFNKENTLLITISLATRVLPFRITPLASVSHVLNISHIVISNYSYAVLAYNQLHINAYNQTVRTINQLAQKAKIASKMDKILSSNKTNTKEILNALDSEHLIIQKTIFENYPILFEQRIESANSMIAYLTKYLELSASRKEQVTIVLGNIQALSNIVMEYAED